MKLMLTFLALLGAGAMLLLTLIWLGPGSAAPNLEAPLVERAGPLKRISAWQTASDSAPTAVPDTPVIADSPGLDVADRQTWTMVPDDSHDWAPDGGYSPHEPTPENADMLAWGEQAEEVNLPTTLCWGGSCADERHLDVQPDPVTAEQIDQGWLNVEALPPLFEVTDESGPSVITGRSGLPEPERD
jgi:hypothetical protein